MKSCDEALINKDLTEFYLMCTWHNHIITEFYLIFSSTSLVSYWYVATYVISQYVAMYINQIISLHITISSLKHVHTRYTFITMTTNIAGTCMMSACHVNACHVNDTCMCVKKCNTRVCWNVLYSIKGRGIQCTTHSLSPMYDRQKLNLWATKLSKNVT